MKKIFTSFFLFFVFAFFLNTAVAQNGAWSFGPAPSGTEASKNKDNTSSVANPLSRAFCYNGNINFQLNKQSLLNTTLTPVGSTVPFTFPGAAAWNYSNNKLYVIDQGGAFPLYTVDTLTGVRTFIANCTGVPHANFTGLTWDPVTGNMYGVSSSITASQIFTVNITTGVCTPIGSPTAVVAGAIMINAAPSGSLFSADIVADNLYRWNKTTGVPTLIGPLGFNANFGQDAAFDMSDGQYYYAAFNATANQAQLRTIDTLTGGGTLIGAYAGQVSTLGVYTPLAPTVTINQAVGQPDPTSVAPINFTAEFSQNVIGFATGDVVITGTAGATTATVTGSGSTYNVSVSGMTQGGTVTVNIPAGVATNTNNEPNEPSTSTDNTVTYSLPSGCTSVNTVPNQTVCAGLPTAPVVFQSPTPGTIFSWTNSNPAIGLAASGNGNIASFIATNPGVAPITGTITVTPFVVVGGGPCTPSAPQTFTNSTPLAIPTGPAVVSSNIVVSGGPTYIMDVNLRTFLQHTFASDLDVTLRSPAGTVVTITTDNGAGNDNVYDGTLWDDDANPLGQVPYTTNNGLVQEHVYANLTLASPLVPEEALAAFIGENANGTWTITISDDLGGDGGTLNSWSLIMTGLAAAPIVTNSTFTQSTPTAIPAGPAVVTSTLVVSGAGTQLLDVNLTTFLQHTFASDLDITLMSPAGTIVTLTTDNGGGFDNVYDGTVWDDDANPLGQVPYTTNNGLVSEHVYANLTLASPLAPEEAFGAFVGENPNGTWTITISDDAGGDAGSLNSWALNLQTAACGTLCAGPSTTFTITVSPNPSIVIIADPGTTICEGDPTLLTVVTGTASPIGTLYTQGTAAINGSPSQVFEPANAAFTSQAADDFVVPAGATWTITGITANGIGAGVPTSVNVFFYSNSATNLPGAAIATFMNVNTFVQAGANYTVTLPSSVVLSGGTYWMSFQVNMSFATSGQWFWGNYGAPLVNREYAWQNPGGGFATPCNSWGYGGTGCNVGGGPANVNNIFSIRGSSITGGGPLPPGYTFLWSPALGLSSTTSNPVAASPMNTTTYTVNVTTPGGCTRTASILITVNKRPVVTTQPVANVRCVGNTATFTVGGTGTGLTYQWQESINGCAGPWVNITNGGVYSGATLPTLTITGVTGLMNGRGYRAVLGGACAPWSPPTNVSNCALLTVNPNPNVSITPAVSCGGVAGIFGTQLSVGSAPPPVPGSVTVNSGAISIPVPDNTTAGVSSNLTVAGIPANATITGVRATWTMPHTWNGDMVFVLRSPNGSILNLDYHLSGTGGTGATTGFVNTTVSSAGVAALSSGTGTYTATFAADARTTAQAPFLAPGPNGFLPTVATWTPMYTPIPNGQWTLAMYDGGPADLGTLTNWSITVDYTTPGGGGGPTLTYVWSPLAGLYTNSTATNAYLGTNTPIVYAAPTQLTVYTVRATDVATGCFTDATAVVNYTPPAPTVTPSSVAMCLGDAAVLLRSSSSTSATANFCSGPISVAIPEGAFPTGPYNPGISTIAVSGIPAASNITRVKVRMNITHAFVGDVVAVLQAPNGQRINLDALLSATNNAGVNFVNTDIGSNGVTALSAGTAPWTGLFKADAVGATFVVFGFTLPGGPVGYLPTTQTWGPLTPTGASANGNWTLALYDAGAPDVGTLTNWCIELDHVTGVPTTRAIWAPLAGLFNDAAATLPYLGTPVDSVWAKPTPAGVYPYTVTVQSLPVASSFTNPANIVINAAGIGTPYPANLTVSGLPTSGVSVDSVRLTGISHTWGNDIDILLQSPTGQNLVLMSDIGGTVAVPNATYTFRDGAPALNIGAANPTGTYSPTNSDVADNWPAPGPGAVAQPTPTIASFGSTVNMNGVWKLFVFDDVGGDAGNISGGFTIWFKVAVPACTSPARTVIVTVNTPTSVTTQPVNQTICTDKVATFTVVPGGSGPFTYQWQVSTNGGNPPWTNITNGGVYSGATTATLTITAPPVSMSGYQYRVVITGAAPCAAAISFSRILIVNPLPTVVITASPTTSLFPGMTTTLSATITPNAPAPSGGYNWLRNGVLVGTGSTHVVNIDNLGDYSLRVTDINGCTNTSNIITIKDSASGKCFIYPNPTAGEFQVRYYSVANNNSLPRTLTVYDAKGDRVFTKQYIIGRPYDRMDVDMRAYGKGLYWVEIGDANGNRITMCRVVIQ